MADPRYQQRVDWPPPEERPDAAQWQRDVADELNKLPPFSVFSFADPNSNVTAQQGSIGVNLASDTPIIYAKKTGNTNTGWVGILATGVLTKTTTYLITGADYTIVCDASGGAFTVSLPVTPLPIGRVHNIKKVDSSVNAVTVAGNGNNIDGVASFTLQTQYEAVTVQWDGTEWWVI
jgi:hypothetical protein